eukprot:TRINITY_DN32177_c0_g1_i1.p1 TRINITY_DN32177_c0_g1~~TRINITY_DN32177_c0_g1_i1.p1  ORF type:complete len:424 (+),score=108.68 TRINITY_DN32177_c0_g1_i1:51-1274(+)
MALTLMFCGLHLAVWGEVARSAQGSKVVKNVGRVLQNMALNAVFAVKKAPMLAILFLTARLCAMQLSPWNGKPQEWVRQSFYITCVAVALEILVAALIGAIGTEELGYYGAHIFRSHPALHVVQQLCNLGAGFGLWSVTVSLEMLVYPNGEKMYLPPSVHCIMFLATMYFVVHGALYFSFFLKHVLDWHWKLMQDTALAAQASVNFCPQLAVLFLAARLRAVEVTSFTGAPQPYVQDCMYLCVFASFVQMATCVALPALSGNKSGFDDDGNATYDLGPAMGMYLVTGIKYVVIISLMIGMLVICFGSATISTENANYAGPDDFFQEIQRLGWVMVYVILAMFLSSAKVVGHAVKKAVETVSVGGVQIRVDKAALCVFRGYINLSNTRITNPRALATRGRACSALRPS